MHMPVACRYRHLCGPKQTHMDLHTNHAHIHTQTGRCVPYINRCMYAQVQPCKVIHVVTGILYIDA